MGSAHFPLLCLVFLLLVLFLPFWVVQELALEALEREVSVQQQIAAAARRLALAPDLNGEQRRRRRQVQVDALRRLHELEEQLRDFRARLGLPVLQPPPLSAGALVNAQGVCLGTRLAQLSQGKLSPSISLVKKNGPENGLWLMYVGVVDCLSGR